MKQFKITEDDFRMHRDEYNGICFSCGAIHWGETEPDAEKYECDECGKKEVYGIEQALLYGAIIII